MFKKRKQSSHVRRRKKEAEDDDHDDEQRSEQASISKNASTSTSSSADEATVQMASKKKRRTPNNVFTIETGKGVDDAKRSASIVHEFKSDDTSSAKTGRELATAHAEYTKDETKSDILENRATNKEARNKFLAGPLRAPAFVRTTCVFDYQPNVCKDYKETGFCGFGDSCIYLHDRGDTIAGWQLEAQWEEKKKKNEKEKERQMNKFLKAGQSAGFGQSDDYSDNDDDDDNKSGAPPDGIPFACHICRDPFSDPVVTSCNHYFCERCILKSFGENPACPICSKDTHGVFNFPQKLLAKKRRLGASDWKEFASKAGGAL
mmetsp:Transcript_17389/g.27087  ORF Transcript_17389/g.27087 Transcript_17389/m.27087 type:complete len:319 (-) Transcript_17389:95-1051(-)